MSETTISSKLAQKTNPKIRSSVEKNSGDRSGIEHIVAKTKSTEKPSSQNAPIDSPNSLEGSSVESKTEKKITPAKLRDLAIGFHQSGDFRKAVGLYKAYLMAYPNDPGIWSNLGAVFRKQKRFQLAVSCYRRGLELDANSTALLGNLANALKDLHRLDEALELHHKVLAAQPDDVKAIMNFACALRVSGKFTQALEQLDKAKTLEPKNAGIEWERAQNLLYMGNYKAAWPAYEARWHTGDLPVKEFPCPRWNGEDLNGKTLLIHSEQGYGDTIFAARFISVIKQMLNNDCEKDRKNNSGREEYKKESKGGRQGGDVTILLQCKPELHRLFSQIGAHKLLRPDETLEHCDYHCPIMSLMGVLDIDHDSIPPPANLYIPQQARDKFASLKAVADDQPQPQLNSQIQIQIQNSSAPLPKNQNERLNPKTIKVGIVWSGSVTFANNDNRSMSLDQFIPLSEIPNVRLYSFQKGPRARELYECGADGIIQDLGKYLEDFADTAAAVECMDVIVMTDSSLAHLAASLNKPVINLLEKIPYWLYTVNEESTPWYSSMKLVKQTEPGDWSGVFEKAKKLLKPM